MTGTISSLDTNHKLFQKLLADDPDWWKLLREDNDLYIEIRKDNYINVYYYGGSIMKLHHNKSDFIFEIHNKYLKNIKNLPENTISSSNYEKLNPNMIDKDVLSRIKSNIEEEYLKSTDNEFPAEKWIQGEMIIKSTNYIDSEFQYNKDCDIGNLRIDLIGIQNSILQFFELKRINDTRLRNDINRNSKEPEIIEQMNKYKMFIEKYKSDLYYYYQSLYDLKKMLGLSVPNNLFIDLDEEPKLIIANTYNKMTKGREERIEDIMNLLFRHNIDFSIISFEKKQTKKGMETGRK